MENKGSGSTTTNYSLVIGVIRDNEFKNIFNILTNNDLGYGLDNLGRLVSATSTDDYMMPYKTGDIITQK